MIGFWLERILELLLAKRGEGAQAIIYATLGWLAAASLIVGIVLGLIGMKWLWGFLVGTFDTILAIVLTRDWKALKTGSIHHRREG